jgi:hypothetical protein
MSHFHYLPFIVRLFHHLAHHHNHILEHLFHF